MLKRLIVVLSVATSMMTPILMTVEPVRASGFGPCSDDRYDVKPRMGHETVFQKVRALIRCAEERWNVSGGADFAIRVADCESGLWPWASNDGNYLGLYQHARSAWVDRVNSLLKARWFNDHQWERLHGVPRGAFLARANVLMSLRMVHNGGWGAWSCA